ncbi:hypothetical protein BKA69DRAFT_112398 [Paraphysoderma sedebokerense]|nr:hypothetical protein BKA69DRAFT_112398 [Paraphysoderma sedebokerense]
MVLCRNHHYLRFFLPLLISVLVPFAGRVLALQKVTSPWYIQNASNALSMHPEAHAIQTLKHFSDYYIFTGMNGSSVIKLYKTAILNPNASFPAPSRNEGIGFETASTLLSTDSGAIKFTDYGNFTLPLWTFDRTRYVDNLCGFFPSAKGNLILI